MELGSLSTVQLREVLSKYGFKGANIFSLTKDDLLALANQFVTGQIPQQREPDADIPEIPQPEAQEIPHREDGLHRIFGEVFRALESDAINNVLLVGPTGTGKTHLARQVAERMELQFYPVSVGPQTTIGNLVGFLSPSGQLIRTPLREAFENGGLYLLDELDGGAPGILIGLNAHLANEYASFPDGILHRNDSFRCIAAANTWGRGDGLRRYVGRNKLDIASLNRFVQIEMSYDEELEDYLVGKVLAKQMRKIRSNAEKYGLEIIVSTRNMLQVKALVERGGFSLDRALDLTIFGGIPQEQREKVIV